jgi:L-ascorbate metabolism protein UlaG (beta-lactamase superfamily)
MEITWSGLSCFKLAERGFASVITDPFDHRQAGYATVPLNADIVTISQDAPAHNCVNLVAGAPYIVRGPGEYEVGGVFITGIQTGGQKGSDHIHNTLYVFDYDALTIAHLGTLSRPPTQAEVEAIGTVHIALVPVGGGASLNAARMAEVIGMIEPKIVIPMHFATSKNQLPLDPLSKFLKEMGITEMKTQPSLRVTKGTMPEETQVIVLEEPQ